MEKINMVNPTKKYDVQPYVTDSTSKQLQAQQYRPQHHQDSGNVTLTSDTVTQTFFPKNLISLQKLPSGCATGNITKKC